MASGSVTSLGSGSGLPLQDTLDKLQANEEKRLDLITSRQDSYKAKLSAYSQLQSAIASLQKAAAALGDPKTLNAVTGSTSGDAVGIRTSAGALPGEYSIEVSQLATTQRLQSAVQNSRTDQIGSGGEISITLADGTTTTLELGSDTSLNGVVKAINARDDLGVNASVVSDGSGGYYLMINTQDTGTDAAVTKIEVTGNNALNNVMSYDAGTPAVDDDPSTPEDESAPAVPPSGAMTQQQAAKNALLKINGIDVTSQSNVVEDVVDNVTFIVSKTTEEDEPVTATVKKDVTAAGAAVQSFVSAYNSLQTTIANLTAFNVTDETQSALTGDSTARNVQTSMAAALRVFMGGGTDVQSLSDIGITTDHNDGSLDIDVEKLNKALNDNPSEVTNLLAGDGGLSKSVGTAATNLLGTDGKSGSLASITKGVQDTIDDLQDEYDRTKSIIDSTIDGYRQQFVALDAMVAQMNSLSSYLTQQFASLSSSNNK